METPPTGQDLFIGIRNGGGVTLQGPFQGLIDEVEVFDHALTDGEVAAIYTAGGAGKCRTCTSAPGGMISWWKAEGDAQDSEDGNNGTLQGGATFAAGEVGSAFTFPNSNSEVLVPDNSSLNQQTLTIDAWITATPLSCEACAAIIAAKTDSNGGGTPTTGYEFGIRQTGKLVFDLNGGAGGAEVFGNANVTDGIPHHVAVTYDGAIMTLYVDGQLDNQQAVVTTIGYNAGDPLIIGNRQSNTAFTVSWPGFIDELEVFGRALSQSEV